MYTLGVAFLPAPFQCVTVYCSGANDLTAHMLLKAELLLLFTFFPA